MKFSNIAPKYWQSYTFQNTSSAWVHSGQRNSVWLVRCLNSLPQHLSIHSYDEQGKRKRRTRNNGFKKESFKCLKTLSSLKGIQIGSWGNTAGACYGYRCHPTQGQHKQGSTCWNEGTTTLLCLAAGNMAQLCSNDDLDLPQQTISQVIEQTLDAFVIPASAKRFMGFSTSQGDTQRKQNDLVCPKFLFIWFLRSFTQSRTKRQLRL